MKAIKQHNKKIKFVCEKHEHLDRPKRGRPLI